MSLPHARPTRRRHMLAFTALLLAPLSGCGALGGTGLGPDGFTVSETDLMRAATRALPQRQRVAEVFDVDLNALQLRMVPERSRIASEVDMTATDRLFRKSLRGRMSFESGLRYDAAAGALKLADVRVDKVDWDTAGLGAGVGGTVGSAISEGLLQRGARLMAEQVLDGMVVYQLDSSQQALLRASGLQPGVIRVTRSGVQIPLTRSAAR